MAKTTAVMRRMLQAWAIAWTGCLLCGGAVGIAAAEDTADERETIRLAIEAALKSVEADNNAAKDVEEISPEEAARLKALATPTHKQTAVIKIGSENDRVTIATFCLTPQGNILAACPRAVITGEDGESDTTGAQLRLLSPDGKLLQTTDIDFIPQAVNVAADGSIYVGGAGNLAKYSAKGKLLTENNSPNTVDKAAMVAKIRKEFALEQERILERDKYYLPLFEQRIERLKKQRDWIAERQRQLESADDNADDGDASDSSDTNEDADAENGPSTDEIRQAVEHRSEMIGAQLERMERQYEQLRNRIENPPPVRELDDSEIERRISRRTKVTGIACTGDKVFVACSVTEGYGFEIWMLNADLKEPVKVCGDHGGCCGQFDIQAYGDNVYAAANCKFSVIGYNIKGEEIISFGKRGRNDVEGFGACCNPMNIRFGAEGDCYTAEASVGAIKRFAKDGTFLGVVAQAELVPGCKHVAIDVSPDGQTVYMLDITRSQIYVFEPQENATPTAEEQASQ